MAQPIFIFSSEKQNQIPKFFQINEIIRGDAEWSQNNLVNLAKLGNLVVLPRRYIVLMRM